MSGIRYKFIELSIQGTHIEALFKKGGVFSSVTIGEDEQGCVSIYTEACANENGASATFATFSSRFAAGDGFSAIYAYKKEHGILFNAERPLGM